jgi:hypothetical protein
MGLSQSPFSVFLPRLFFCIVRQTREARASRGPPIGNKHY